MASLLKLEEMHARLCRLEEGCCEGVCNEHPTVPLKVWTVVCDGGIHSMHMSLMRRGYQYVLELDGQFISKEFHNLSMLNMEADRIPLPVRDSVAVSVKQPLGRSFSLEFPDGTRVGFTAM